MSSLFKRVMCVAVLALAGLGLLRAALLKYQEKERALREAVQAQLKQSGLTRDAAKAKYPTPQIGLVSSGCLLPGSTGEVVVQGKFAPGTKFVIENDNIEVVKESATATEYRATVKVASGIGPQKGGVWAMAPSGVTASSSSSIAIGGRYEWQMEAQNGWKVVAQAPTNKACGGSSDSEDRYEVSFYRKGEASPFERRKASLYHDPFSRENYRFSISREDPQSASAQQDMMALMQKMADPKLTSAQRDAIMKQIEQAQKQMMANMTKMTDPNYAKQLEAKRLQFGCEHMSLAVAGTNFTGDLQCAPAVGARIPVTGALKYLGK